VDFYFMKFVEEDSVWKMDGYQRVNDLKFRAEGTLAEFDPKYIKPTYEIDGRVLSPPPGSCSREKVETETRPHSPLRATSVDRSRGRRGRRDERLPVHRPLIRRGRKSRLDRTFRRQHSRKIRTCVQSSQAVYSPGASVTTGAHERC
jgi:hypothetical protein